MIDEVIKAHIDAINANTEALNRLISLFSKPSATPLSIPDVKFELFDTQSAPATTRPSPAFVNPAPAPAPVAPAPAPAPAEPAPAQPAMTLEQLRGYCATAGANGHTQDVIDFLRDRGLKRVSELQPSQYEELLAYLKDKGAL